jgi:chromosome segregation ATPase
MQTPPNQQKAQNQAEQESRIKYVEELASAEAYPPGDAWISITDAARVTRTSEAMARRWVTSGRLPIKPGDYGIPPRTRLVRLSDVAKIRPIVDPTAAVSDDTRKLDLPSIPRQQAQIMEEHQRLLVEIGTLQLTIEQVKNETRAQFQEQLDTLKKQFTLITTLEEQVKTLREELARQLEEIRGTATTQQGELERQAQALTALQGQLHEAQAAFAASIAASEQAQQARLDAAQAAQGQQLAEMRASLQQAQATLREEAARALAAQAKLQQAALESQAQTFNQALEQQARDFGKDLATLESDQAKDVAMLTSQIESQSIALAQANDAITAAKAAAQDSRAASRAQENRINELQQELEEERSARRELSQQLAALTQRVTTLSSEKGQSTGRERRK